jgi:hypothetical protein
MLVVEMPISAAVSQSSADDSLIKHSVIEVFICAVNPNTSDIRALTV